MNRDELNDRTWLQLRECVLTAVPVLETAADDGIADAREALERIRHILSEDWVGLPL